MRLEYTERSVTHNIIGTKKGNYKTTANLSGVYPVNALSLSPACNSEAVPYFLPSLSKKVLLYYIKVLIVDCSNVQFQCSIEDDKERPQPDKTT